MIEVLRLSCKAFFCVFKSWMNTNVLVIYLLIALNYYIDIEKSKKIYSLVFDISDKRMR